MKLLKNKITLLLTSALLTVSLSSCTFGAITPSSSNDAPSSSNNPISSSYSSENSSSSSLNQSNNPISSLRSDEPSSSPAISSTQPSSSSRQSSISSERSNSSISSERSNSSISSRESSSHSSRESSNFSSSNGSHSSQSSSSEPSSSSELPIVEEKFTVRWVDYDGTLLKEETDVLKGTTVHYGEDTPIRAEDETYTYTFSRWEPSEGQILRDTTYTAIYNGQKKPVLMVTIKKNETYGFYSMELDSKEAHYTFDYNSLNQATYSYDSDIPEDYPDFNLNLVKEVVFGDNIEVVADMVDSYALSKVVFSSEVKELKNSLFYTVSRANEIIDVFFEGDRPTIGANTLKTNGGFGLRCYYLEGKQGFSESYICGQPFMIYGKTYDLPDMTLEEYALLAVKESRLLAKRMEILYNQKPDLKFYPYTNLETYKEIKDFTLELTKDCANKKDQAETCYEWLANNIVYDDEYTFTKLEDDWNDRKAVCAGYAALLHDMLASLDILSFYTRGIANYNSGYSYQDLAEGNSFENGNHAWISALIDEEVVIMDATWGASGYQSFDMSDEIVASRYVTIAVDFINVIPEGFNYYMYNQLTILNDDNEIYCQYNGVLTGGLSSTYNYKIFYSTTARDNPYMVRNNIVKNDNNVGNWKYALANGRLISFLDAAYYEDIEKTYYSKTFQIDFFDTYLQDYTMQNGLLIKMTSATTASVAKCFNVDEIVNIPSEIDGHNITSIEAKAFDVNLHIKAVTIPDTVTRIERQAFCECAYLETVTLSQNVEFIGILAFGYCYRLTEIVLPESLLELDENAFSQCYSLERVTIGRNLNQMNRNTAFTGCYSVKEYIVSGDNTFFKAHKGALYTFDLTTLIAYCNGDGKEEVSLPNSTKTITSHAFHNNPTMKTINLHEGLEYIDDGAFCGSAITSLIIPASVKKVGAQAFDICQSLTSIVMNCEGYAFTYCGYQEVPFVENLANYENGLLYAGKVLLRCISTDEHIKIKEGTTNIAYGAFQDIVFNNGLYTKSVLLPSSIKHINDYAFVNAKKLEKVIMTNSIQKVYPSAFDGCPLLNEIIYVGTEEEFGAVEVDNRWQENTMFLSAKKTFVSSVPEQYQ